MAMPRTPMDQQKEIQHLKPLLKSIRKVAAHMGIHRDTVSKYWERPVPESLPSNPPPEWTTTIDWEYVKKEIENGVSAKTLYKEFSLSQVL